VPVVAGALIEKKSTARILAPVAAISVVKRPSPQASSKTVLEGEGCSPFRCKGTSSISENTDRQPSGGGTKGPGLCNRSRSRPGCSSCACRPD